MASVRKPTSSSLAREKEDGRGEAACRFSGSLKFRRPAVKKMYKSRGHKRDRLSRKTKLRSYTTISMIVYYDYIQRSL